MNENSESAIRVSNRTSVTGVGPERRTVATACSSYTDHTTRTVVVVSKDPPEAALESIPNLEFYDIVFVEWIGHPYSQIKRVMRDLVIVCVDTEDMSGFQVLSMLNVDDITSRIPVVTYATAPRATCAFQIVH